MTTNEPEAPVTSDIRTQFHGELDHIQAETLRLAAMVTERIPWGTEVLLGTDLAAAQALIDADDDLDVLSIELEERCYQALVLQAPMARDLRFLVTALRLVSELERSGDLMVNVAKAMRRLYGTAMDPKLRGLISRMGEEAQRLMLVAIDAYAEADEGKAAALDDMDDRLDNLHKDYIQAIFESHRAGNVDLEAGVQLALVGRYYERIGDHAVNIGERVRYMVSGWLPEHTGAARVAARTEHPPPGD
ncbi:MAG: phosphate signaling complex protein PhoU [Actinobacteria bacterium]|nr:phosphate signaling complex protein PhoU [Actinomycetota bacterium]